MKFNGKEYHLAFERETKGGANMDARAHRRDGGMARVRKVKLGGRYYYQVWVRG